MTVGDDQCPTGKVVHITPSSAHTAMNRTIKSNRRRSDGRRLNVYRCATCHHWHVGSQFA